MLGCSIPISKRPDVHFAHKKRIIVTNHASRALTVEIADRQTVAVDFDPLISVVRSILNDHGILRGEISIALVDDAEIRKINKQYLQHDYETDVISFVLEYDEVSEFLSGQLVVSTETAGRSCEAYESSFASELLLYVIHGCLHLVGYDDHETEDVVEMRKAEQKYLRLIGESDQVGDRSAVPLTDKESGSC